MSIIVVGFAFFAADLLETQYACVLFSLTILCERSLGVFITVPTKN